MLLCCFHFGFPCFSGQIDKRLKSLERCQSLEEIQRLFESADFESVVRLLQPTLNYGSRSKSLEFVSSAPERPAQLMLLQVTSYKSLLNIITWINFLSKCMMICDGWYFSFSVTVTKNSLLKIEDHQQCLESSELALNEALQQLNSASTNSPPGKEEWVSTIAKLLDGIAVCFSKETELLNNVTHLSSMARLANNLIQVRRELPHNLPWRNK